MELSLYTRVLRRWFLLIAAGTVIALAVGVAIQHKNSLTASSPSFQGKADTVVNYVAPGNTYVPGASINAAVNTLLPHVNDPGATEISPRAPRLNYTSLTDYVDPSTGDLVVIAQAPTRNGAKTAANRAALYLASLQDARVHEAAIPAVRFDKNLAKREHKALLRYVREAALTPATKPVRKLILTTEVSDESELWEAEQADIVGLKHPVLPPASVIKAKQANSITAQPLSPIKTVLPAGIIGLVLSFLLATLLESRRVVVPVQAATVEAAAPAATRVVPMVEQPVVPATVAEPAAEPPPIAQPVATSDPGIRTQMLLAMAEPMAQTAELVWRLIDVARPSIFITSPSDSEPKSETATGLAAALVLTGKRVVLVDADPSAASTRFFGLSERPGLTDFLGYPQGSIQQLIYPENLATANGSLWVLPHGIRPMEDSSAASPDGDAWDGALSQLASTGVVVIVDGPTVLDHPGLMNFASAVGGVVVALRQERTGSDVTQSYDVLRARGSKLLGVVANPTTLSLGSDSGPAEAVRVPESRAHNGVPQAANPGVTSASANRSDVDPPPAEANPFQQH